MCYDDNGGDGGMKKEMNLVQVIFFFFNFRDTYANLRDIFKTESTIFSLLYALSINGTTYFSFSTKTWATPHIIVIIIYYIPL